MLILQNSKTKKQRHQKPLFNTTNKKIFLRARTHIFRDESRSNHKKAIFIQNQSIKAKEIANKTRIVKDYNFFGIIISAKQKLPHRIRSLQWILRFRKIRIINDFE